MCPIFAHIMPDFGSSDSYDGSSTADNSCDEEFCCCDIFGKNNGENNKNSHCQQIIDDELFEQVANRSDSCDNYVVSPQLASSPRRPLIFRRSSRSRVVVCDYHDVIASSDDDDDENDDHARDSPSLLTAQRVNQMTKVFYDIDSTSLLLEERERDLELAARIGQSLLERNNELNTRNEALEQRLSALNDIVAQLNHKLELKSDLLAFYTQALDSAENEDHLDSTSPSLSSHLRHSASPKSPFRSIRDEDLSRPKSTSCSVSVQCDEQHNADGGILQTCLKQLTFVSDEVDRLTHEVATKTAEVLCQQSEIESLTHQIFSLQSNLMQSDDENARMGERLEEAKEAQSLLANEVGGLKSRYDECLDLLREAQQEIRALKKRQRSCRPIVHYFTTPTAEEKQLIEASLDETVVSTPTKARSSTASSSLLMEVGDASRHTCTCQSGAATLARQTSRRVSSDCDSDAGYAADSDSMLESLVCSPNPGNNLTIRTLSPCFSSLSSQPEGTPRFPKSPNLSHRVKLVKDMEGSVTMHRWQALAHPSLSSSALDSLPGILAKEHDPISDIPLYRNKKKKQPEEGEASLRIVTGVEASIDLLNSDDDDDLSDICVPQNRRTNRPPIFLLDDEETLYGDFEFVESRLPNGLGAATFPQDMVHRVVSLCRTPQKQDSESADCCEAAESTTTGNGIVAGIGSFFTRLAGIHRRKGVQGLNLSPPQSSPMSLMTRSLMVADRSCSPGNSNSSNINNNEKQHSLIKNDPKPMMYNSFYHPVPSCDGGPLLAVPDSSFTSSFLPKYRQFLLKNNLSNQLFGNNQNASTEVESSSPDGELDETQEEEPEMQV